MAEEGAVAVCVRVRPLSSREEELGEATQVYWKTDNNAIYQVDGSKSFNFDRVFHSSETTKNVYEEIAVPIIDSAIQGYNGTIFAYGQTASGKTHTMMGSEDCLGVIPRAIHDIFQKIKKFPEREFLLRVSYMEIYNEIITDLLCNTQKMKPLIIREDINRNVYVADLTEEVVYTSEMALQWITKGEKNRHYGITKMNQRSSRSHTIFRMILESREKGEPSNCEGSIKVSHLNLVDLAGSERAAQTGAEGVRLKEGCNINRSLFILGQVIKKLSDGQIGGFINYRDSKLTRILQNSLGGNAKTRIICTITPVSFDETLSTLQFASTAKYMKNTPYVNEVSSDEALLKRYRKEIVDLKKQLEEVSIKTRAQEMEKDQLAQLLDEKDLLQKVQDEKIQNLTRMLVTSSSLTMQQELKAKRKRRVTWCFGKINKMKDSNYVNEFNMPANVTTRRHKTDSAVLGEIDESLYLESDVFSNTLDSLTEIEWNSATKLLSQENLESELNSLRAKYDNLVLDCEQLRRENEEMGLKLKEKNDLDEFEALERKAEKDQEMQLIHEISNLKNLVKHAEVYNQDLENELNSKVKLLEEKEDQIKNLQKYIDTRKSENIKMDLSYSLENTEDLKQMQQTLFDAETVALDAKKQSAFLRSENLELKEKMKELESTCKQMENDIQLYQSQLEAKKKMQVDLDKELQSAFNEITTLNSLIDGKVPKDLLCNLELERRITELQKELNRESKENEALRKEVDLLSELKSLPHEMEMLRKEIHEKSEELSIITSEKDKLFSEVAHKESRIQGLLEEIEKTKDDLTTTQLNYKSTEQEFQDFKTLHIECEQKYKMVLKKNERMNQEIGNLSKEAENLGLSLDALKTELSHKTQELQQKTTEGQERLNEVEQLKEQLESRDSRLQAVEKETTLITEKLQKALEEVKTLTREKDDLKQLQESLQIERDQLKSDIQDTINLNIDSQEQLRSALESLKQHQETINTLKMKNSEETSGNSLLEENLGKTKDEFQQKKELNRESKESEALRKEVDLLSEFKYLSPEMEMLRKEIHEKSEELSIITSEKDKLFSEVAHKESRIQGLLEEIEKTKDDLTTTQLNYKSTEQEFQDFKTLHIECEQKYKMVLKKNERMNQEIGNLSKEAENLGLSLDALKTELSHKTQELQQKTTEGQERLNEVEQLKEQLESRDSRLQAVEKETTLITEKLQKALEEVKTLTREKDDLKQLQESLQIERDQLKSDIQDTINLNIDSQEQLRSALESLKQHQETINTLKMKNSEETSGNSLLEENLGKTKDEFQQKVGDINKKQNLEAKTSQALIGDLKDSDVTEQQKMICSLIQEKNELQQMLESITAEKEQLKTDLKENIEMTIKNQEELRILEDELKKQQEIVAQEKNHVMKKDKELSKTCERLAEVEEKLKEKDLEKQEELRIAHMDLKEHQETIDKLQRTVSEKNDEILNMQMNLENAKTAIKAQIQELREKEHQLLKVKNDLKENVYETEQLKKQLEAQNSALESLELEKLMLTQKINESLEKLKLFTEENDGLRIVEETLKVERDKLRENLRETEAKNLQDNFEEMKSVMKERDNIRRSEEMLKLERDQLKENLQDTIAKDLETQQELKLIHMYLKEQQQTIEKFREKVSGKTTQIINIQKDLDKSKDELQKKIQELQEKELQLLKMNKDVNKSDKKMNEMEHLKRQIEAQNVSVKTVDMDNLCSTKKLHENLEEIRTVAKESNELRRKKECLKMERDQFREIIRKMIARDHQNHKEIIKYERSSLCDGEEHNTESLREKCFRIKELLQRYSEMDNHYEYLNKLSFDLEKEIETQKDLSIRVKANLLLPYPQTKQIQKLFAANQRCSMEFHRVIKKLKYVLSYITKMKEEQHESINKFEIAFIDEVEKQNELQIKIQHLQQDYDIPSKELRHSKLNQSLDLHIEEILKDFSENDFPSIKTELQVFSNRKKMTQVLEEWLSTPFNIEELKNSIQKENDSICQVNYFYHNKITGIINESTEFEERSVTRSKEWEHDLKSIIEKNKKLFEDYQTLTVSPISGAQANPIVQDNKNPHVTSRAVQPTERIQELENSLREAKESAVHKESKIIKMQKELEMTNNIIAKLQAKINESNKCLDKTKEKMQALQDQVALGAKPYKEEIEDLKTKLVKIDLEKMKTAKEFEKEIHSTKATIDYQKEVIRVLRENLRRSQQAQDASMISEHTDSQPSNKPITCGGGSGIIQSTKALILKSEYIRLEKEISKLKQQNEQLIKQKNDLLSNNQHLSNEVKTWKERTLKREVCKEVTCENSPKSPKVTETDSKKIQNIPSQYKEQNVQNPVPKESPKSWFFDNRSKSLPAPRPVRYFDNSSLGLCPEEQTIGAECVDPKPGPWYTSGKDAPECKTQ
uniref:centromere-associated protein E isoform X2 n=1 Tax=Ictidomys tridecemlineatus TaxID=43179 RepID=UPI001A9E9BC2|nr:centromere-associated protein E isoform X2 [Ictidomys tridecemlineatus]